MDEVPPGIDAEGVARFFAEHVPEGDTPLRFSLISGGRSNLTYRVDAGPRTFVLRRPPLGHVLPTAHDMAREYRVITALVDTRVPVPRTFALCEDEAANGAPFYVMEYRPGVVVEDHLPAGFAAQPEERAAISRAFMDTLADLHAVDPASVGLADFGRPEGYLERQIGRWSKQWQRSQTAPLPEIDQLIARLRASLPARSGAALVHGDYRLGNVALDPDDPGRVIAVFDWEMATLGDPLADLGYTLIYWVEERDPPDLLRSGAATAAPGFLSRDALVERYAEASGRDVGDIDFYRVLALYKLAVISEGIWSRYRQGKTLGEGFEGMQRTSEALARRALAIADASSTPGLRGGAG